MRLRCCFSVIPINNKRPARVVVLEVFGDAPLRFADRVSSFVRSSGDCRGGELLADRMDGGEYISSMENMDPTLAELGDEFTLGDIDGECCFHC